MYVTSCGCLEHCNLSTFFFSQKSSWGESDESGDISSANREFSFSPSPTPSWAPALTPGPQNATVGGSAMQGTNN